MTAPDGPFRVIKHWTRWTLEDLSNWDSKQPIYDTQPEAQAEADRRNETYARMHTRPPKPAQPDLFNQQEATS